MSSEDVPECAACSLKELCPSVTKRTCAIGLPDTLDVSF